ncbi:conserved exported protein of unknown function [Tenacibaculum sp. 190130A14a]|uniref:DUF4468 domain-containing protein n=1 Tax=Tenacibaculum polynesiense TaxID=3137857 RepID=A0ABM9P9B5_9FLAO
MKKILLSAMLFTATISFAQEVAKAEFKESKITSLVYTVDSLEELKTIDWKDVKEIFKDSKDSIQLGFRVKNGKSEVNKLKYKHSFEIKSMPKDIDGSIDIAKRLIKVLEEI